MPAGTPRQRVRFGTFELDLVPASCVKGRYFLQQANEAARLKRREFFEQSAAADPNFALARVGLSNDYAGSDTIPPAEAMPRPNPAALRALAARAFRTSRQIHVERARQKIILMGPFTSAVSSTRHQRGRGRRQ